MLIALYTLCTIMSIACCIHMSVCCGIIDKSSIISYAVDFLNVAVYRKLLKAEKKARCDEVLKMADLRAAILVIVGRTKNICFSPACLKIC